MGLFSFRRKESQIPRTKKSVRSRQNQAAVGRSTEADHRLDPLLPEKQRARRRLVGAIILILLAIIVLPLVLDQHPKPDASSLDVRIIHQAASSSTSPSHEQMPITRLSMAGDLDQQNVLKEKKDQAHYIVQIGVLSDLSNAQYWLNRLKKLNIPAYIEIQKDKNNKIVKAFLRAGPFDNRETAKYAVDQVKKAGLN